MATLEIKDLHVRVETEDGHKEILKGVKDGEQVPRKKKHKEEILTDVTFTLGSSEG